MHNWHRTACSIPNVTVLDGHQYPTCLACDAKASEGSNETTISTKDTGLVIPQSDPTNLGLRWPFSINFSSSRETSAPKPPDPIDSSTKTPPGTATTTDIMYQPLQGQRTRVLIVDPADDPTYPVHVDIDTVRLDRMLDFDSEYEALSYTWANEHGDARETGTIYVGPAWHAFRVTENCLAAIRRVRYRAYYRRLWVDSICIDQANISERTHQVGMMQQVYARAKRVLVYLGSGNDNIYSRPYFSRIWVIQEIASARSAIVFWDRDKEMDWITFYENARKSYQKVSPWLKHFRSPRIMEDADLYKLLHDTMSCQSSDPRDRIFALLGLKPFAEFDGLAPDYSLSTPAVLIGITAYMLAKLPESRRDFFQAAVDLGQQDGLPSWVPYWNHPWPEHILELSPRDGLALRNKSPREPEDWTSRVHIDIDTGSLCFKGTRLHLISTVTRLTSPFVYDAYWADSRMAVNLASLKQFADGDVVFSAHGMGFALVIRPDGTDEGTSGRLVGICSIVTYLGVRGSTTLCDYHSSPALADPGASEPPDSPGDSAAICSKELKELAGFLLAAVETLVPIYSRLKAAWTKLSVALYMSLLTRKAITRLALDFGSDSRQSRQRTLQRHFWRGMITKSCVEFLRARISQQRACDRINHMFTIPPARPVLEWTGRREESISHLPRGSQQRPHYYEAVLTDLESDVAAELSPLPVRLSAWGAKHYRSGSWDEAQCLGLITWTWYLGLPQRLRRRSGNSLAGLIRKVPHEATRFKRQAESLLRTGDTQETFQIL